MSTAERSATSLAARMRHFQSAIDSIMVTDRAGNVIATESALVGLVAMLHAQRSRKGTVYIVGNGGSAAVAGHCATDLLNVGGLRATTLHESSMMTCMANDYGYEQGFAQVLSTLAQPQELLIAISSSGKSANIRNAATTMREIGGEVVTLSGFAADNPLRSLGDINIWLDSKDYGMVEIGHQFVLHNISDRLLSEKKSH